jgi:hypothetical protein
MSFKDVQAFISMDDEVRGDLTPYPQAPLLGAHHSEADWSINAYPDALGLLLATFFGTGTPALIETGCYDHTFMWNPAAPRSMGFQVQKGNVAPRKIAGFRINQLEFSVEAGAGNLLVVKSTGGGKFSSETTETELSAITTQPFRFWQASVDMDGQIYPDNFSLTLNAGIKLDNYKLSGTQDIIAQDVESGIFKPTGAFQVNFESWDNFDAYLAGTPFALEVVFLSDEAIVSGKYYTLTITLPACRFVDMEGVKVDNLNLLKEPLKFEAYAGTIGEETEPIQIVLRDGVATH